MDSSLAPLQRLQQIMAHLRGPQGCPWDREQTFASLVPQLIEECYEVVEAIEALDDGNSAALCEELGDLLLHIVFHAQMAHERGWFDLDAIAHGICEKLVRRHPHVFGDNPATTSEEVLQNWQAIKKAEKPERTSVLDGVPPALPALMRAQEISKKAARVGFDWKTAPEVLVVVAEELAEMSEAVLHKEPPERIQEEIGDVLFAVVNFARHMGVDGETALRVSTQKFIRRFAVIEQAVTSSGRPWEQWSQPEFELLWQHAKQLELANQEKISPTNSL